MKIKLLIIIITSIALLSFSNKDSINLKGTWEVVSFNTVRNGQITKVLKQGGDNSQIKTWSNEYFLFVGRFKQGDETRNNFGGGTYTIKGNRYSENIQYHVGELYVGRTVRMYMEMKGDTLIQIFPVNKNWEYDKNNCQIERHIRLD